MTDGIETRYERKGEQEVCSVFLTAPLSDRFPSDLLGELFAVAQPEGLGAITAFALRGVPLEHLIDEGVREAAHYPHRPDERRHDDVYFFDYVAGYRVKVWFFPNGLEEDEENPLSFVFPGRPVVFSGVFDDMYGRGALEALVRLAIAR